MSWQRIVYTGLFVVGAVVSAALKQPELAFVLAGCAGGYAVNGFPKKTPGV